MKKKNLFLLGSISLITAVIMPLALTSCANTISGHYAKIVTINNMGNKPASPSPAANGTVNQTATKYTQLGNSNITIKEAIFGTNKINDGNYIFAFGSIANSGFRTFLYGPNGNDGEYSNLTANEQYIYSSPFLKNFFSTGAIGNGRFNSTSTGVVKSDVQVLLYADMPKFNPNASIIDGTDGYSAPFDVFDRDQVLNKYNQNRPDGDYYTLETLPNNAKFQIGRYKRYDDSARLYREFYEYVKILRPNGTYEDNGGGGIIAFKKNANPKSFAIGVAYDEVEKYFTE